MAFSKKYLDDLDKRKIDLNLLGYKKDDDFIPKKISSEEDLKNYILQEYTFLKRPVFIIENQNIVLYFWGWKKWIWGENLRV